MLSVYICILVHHAAVFQAEEVLQVFAKDFRQFWEVVSNKEASVDMVDACLKGAYRLGITQPQYRCWLPLSKVGETMAILKIMHSNLCMDRGDLAQSVHDAQAAVALTIIPGSSACCPKAMSAMWFAQACRALGRVSVVRAPRTVAVLPFMFSTPFAFCKCRHCHAVRVSDHRIQSHVRAGHNMHATHHICTRMLTSLLHHACTHVQTRMFVR